MFSRLAQRWAGRRRPDSSPAVSPASPEWLARLPGLWFLATPQGELIDASPGVREWLGLAPGSISPGHSISAAYADPSRHQQFLGMIASALDPHTCLPASEFQLKGSQGRRKTVIQNGSRLEPPDVAQSSIFVTMMEWTGGDRHREEWPDGDARALAFQAYRARYMERAGAPVRTSLNEIVALAQLLGDSEHPASCREAAETLIQSSQSLLLSVTELIEIARLDLASPPITTAGRSGRMLAEDVTSAVAPFAFAKGLELVCSVSPDLPDGLLFAEDAARQIATRLLMNAIRFTSEGEVVLSLSLCQSGQIRLEVGDTGCGMNGEQVHSLSSRAALLQLPDPESRKHPLGFRMIQYLVQQIGGTINVESFLGYGTTVTVMLPATLVESEPSPGPSGPAVLAQWRSAAVMLVSESAERALTALLKAEGVTVHSIEEPSELPALSPETAVFADLALAASPPFQAAAAIRRQRVVALAPSGRQPIPAADWNGLLLEKPVRRDDLQRLLAQLWPQPALPATAPVLLSETGSPVLNHQNTPPVRILAAEDNAINQLVIRRLVERLGYSVDIVPNGREAVHSVAQGDYSLVLMDCQMPEMDGFQATAEIRKLPGAASAIPIIAVTAHAVRGDRDHCLNSGMDDYLSKPVLLEDLSKTLSRWLE